MTNGKGSEEGIPKVIGLVPNMGSTPYVGAIDGRALVPVSPILEEEQVMVASKFIRLRCSRVQN